MMTKHFGRRRHRPFAPHGRHESAADVCFAKMHENPAERRRSRVGRRRLPWKGCGSLPAEVAATHPTIAVRHGTARPRPCRDCCGHLTAHPWQPKTAPPECLRRDAAPPALPASPPPGTAPRPLAATPAPLRPRPRRLLPPPLQQWRKGLGGGQLRSPALRRCHRFLCRPPCRLPPQHPPGFPHPNLCDPLAVNPWPQHVRSQLANHAPAKARRLYRYPRRIPLPSQCVASHCAMRRPAPNEPATPPGSSSPRHATCRVWLGMIR
mmetsp:Transcript_92797/g.266844  ORF Transcript_92797/g.266844 Transcript_92797/m.266844 type:complete len:265 (+) Transcript_92797:736-1530(+)